MIKPGDKDINQESQIGQEDLVTHQLIRVGEGSGKQVSAPQGTDQPLDIRVLIMSRETIKLPQRQARDQGKQNQEIIGMEINGTHQHQHKNYSRYRSYNKILQDVVYVKSFNSFVYDAKIGKLTDNRNVASPKTGRQAHFWTWACLATFIY